MPLFSFKCTECEHLVEKFLHNPDDKLEIECSECGNAEFERQFSLFGNRVWLEAKDFYKNKIAPDAKNIMDKMNKGSDKDFFDVYGDE